MRKPGGDTSSIVADSTASREASGAARPDAGTTPRAWVPALHLLALWAFAVAQPLFDVLRQNGEFFIAYRTQPLDLILFAALIAVGVPLLLVLPYLLVAWVAPRAGRVLLIALVALLTAALASQIMAHRVALGTATHFAIALAVGAAFAWLYTTRAGLRGFLTALAVSVVFFPALFLLHPSMAAFLRSDTRGASAAAVIDGSPPPIVFLVFDQLPLTSLMNARGGIDRDQYPGFAALAETATWYRNASTVADFTGWALPPIVSGMRPQAGRTPTTRTYPNNLFTWLGGRYRLEVQEPITQLCPEWLCDAGREPLGVRLAGMALDSSVVYLTTALPAGLRARLPSLNENWRNFIDARRWQGRWIAERDQDRRRVPEQVIDAISRDDPQPTLYFAHSLLPHEPYIYLPSGQQFTDEPRLHGMLPTGRWMSDPWPVTLAYRQHLVQVGYVDAVVGRVIARLKAEGLFDRTLLVVTSDHGASFRPGFPFKGLQGDTIAEMAAVPLFVKAPGQRTGAVDDRNVQSVDIMPIVSGLLGVPLTWETDGRRPDAAGAEPATKTIHHTGARNRLVVDAEWLARSRDAAVARKAQLFGEHPGWRAHASTRPDLIGQPVDALDVVDGPFLATVDGGAARLRAVSSTSPVIPALLSGRVRDGRGQPVDADVAIAVGGVIGAVTTTFRPEIAARGTWIALVNPRDLVEARGDVQVLVLPRDRSAPLHRAYSSNARPEHLNLASNGAREFWSVTQTGFYAREGAPVAFRWTSGEGVLVVPLEPDRTPRSLRLGLFGVRPGGTDLAVSINDCTLYSGVVSAGPWYRTFPLRACPASTLQQPEARIVVRSSTWTPNGESRTLGVAVETVNLLLDDWPIGDDGTRQLKAAIRGLDPPAAQREAGQVLRVELANIGTATWLPAADAPAAQRAIHIAVRWRPAAGRSSQQEQRLDLPRPVYPTDRLVLDAPLIPPGSIAERGPWTVTVVPVASDGTALPVEEPFVVEVIARR